MHDIFEAAGSKGLGTLPKYLEPLLLYLFPFWCKREAQWLSLKLFTNNSRKISFLPLFSEMETYSPPIQPSVSSDNSPCLILQIHRPCSPELPLLKAQLLLWDLNKVFLFMHWHFYIQATSDYFLNRQKVACPCSHTLWNLGKNHWKEWNNAICSNMDGPRDCHTKWRKSDREGEILYDIPYMWNLKRNDTGELTEQKQIHKLREWTKVVGEGERGEGIVREFGMDMHTLLYLKWITSKSLLYSIGNSAQLMWQPGWEGSLGENEYMCM